MKAASNLCTNLPSYFPAPKPGLKLLEVLMNKLVLVFSNHLMILLYFIKSREKYSPQII